MRTGWVAKWAGLLVCVVIALAFGLSMGCGWSVFRVGNAAGYSYTLGADLSLGDLRLHRSAIRPLGMVVPPGWHGSIVRIPPMQRMIWRPSYQSDPTPPLSGSDVFVTIPLWIVLVVAAIPTGLLWWRDRKRRGPGACVKCGYDLKGLAVGAPCPECGRRPE
jgi:hypothetical protein